MNQDYPLNNTPISNVDNPLAVMQPGEKVICEIRRHPIGLIGVYVMAGLVLAIALCVAILVPIYASFLTDQQKLGVVLGAGLAMVITALFAYVGIYVYQQNRWIVTSDSITQVEQVGLFNRHSSQLSLANLEDVSARQDGVLQAMFGYGILTVESAGERSKFVFSFCPNPNEYARKIIAAHEEYIALRPEEARAFNQPLASVQGFNQPYPGSGESHS